MNTWGTQTSVFFYLPGVFKNTIQSHLLVQKLFRMNIDARTFLWILHYLTNRPKFIRISSPVISDTMSTIMGGPQGKQLCALLFFLYTAERGQRNEDCALVKFTDNTEYSRPIPSDDDSHYRQEIDHFAAWCNGHYVALYVEKRKEIIIDLRKDKVVQGELFRKLDSC